MWVILSLCSALLLGLYDLAKKSAVKDNAVPPVLLLNVLTAAIIYTPIVVYSSTTVASSGTHPLVTPLSFGEHLLLLAKSVLVGFSWSCAFFALKHLPLSIASPIRATSPLWTILIAVTALGESPSPVQWLGIATILVAFGYFTTAGKEDGVRVTAEPWVGLMLIATLAGSLSALYDKYLLQECGLTPVTVQAWFSIYLCPVMTPLAVYWFIRERHKKPFQFRWTIPLIAIFLLSADILYFQAVSDPRALISLISPVRRTSVIIPFAFGIIVLSEKQWRIKAACVLLMLLGVLLIGLRT